MWVSASAHVMMPGRRTEPMNIQIPESLSDDARPVRIQKMSRRGWIVLGAAGVLILAFVVYRVFFSGAEKSQRPPPPVVVQTVAQGTMPVVEHTIGTVVSNATVQLTARVQGQLLKAYFTEGQTVQAGQVLFQIDPGPYRAALDSALATLSAARTKADRYAKLLAQKAIAPQDADDARAAYLTAQAAAETARLNLSYTSVRSPIGGKTGPILIQPGNQVTAAAGTSSTAASATQSTVLVVITQVQPVKISLALPQADLPRIQARMAAHDLTIAVDTHGATGKPLTAPVDFVSNAVDDKTGTIELRATFPNQDGFLVPGQLVDVGVMLDNLKGVAMVPHEAVNVGPNGRYVYLVRDGKAAMVPVDVLHDDGDKAALGNSVKPGDRVIVDGQLRVIPGKPVTLDRSAKTGRRP
jgi:multidrug efflux system membrane fusion protein